VAACGPQAWRRIRPGCTTPPWIMQKIGILGNLLDMTPETTFIKLAWLLSNHPKQVKELLSHNLRGELSLRLNDTDFIE